VPKIREYVDAQGRSPYAKWFDGLDARAAAKVAIALVRMEQGNLSNVKGVGAGISEYRINFGPGYRIYFGMDGEALVILLGGGTKKRQGKDIEGAQGPVAGIQTAQATGDVTMALTRDFKETIQARVVRDPAFREALLKQGVECLLAGDMDTGKAVLRDYINATVGFEELGALTDKSPKSLMRMFGPTGNPQACNLFEIIALLQHREGLHFRVEADRDFGG
jgi:putative addiction module killer protein